jgi:hypothetical protein
MVTSDRSDRHQGNASKWFESVEEGIHVHWLPIPYSNKMPYGKRIRAFVRFAVDARHGYREVAEDGEAGWRLAAITGCVYLDRGQVFVQKGDEYRPAAFLLGKNVKAAADSTCRPRDGAAISRPSGQRERNGRPGVR